MPCMSWRGSWDVCSLPLMFDSYKSCGFNCDYCYAKETHKLNIIEPYPLKELQKMKRVGLKDNDGRAQKYKWGYDNITVRLGYLTDPFPYIESELKATLEFMKEFENRSLTIITKNPSGLTDEHLGVASKIKEFAVQVSFSSDDGRFEKNAPSVEDRINAMKRLTEKGVLVAGRLQPTTSHIMSDEFIKRVIDTGVYGISISYPELNGKLTQGFEYNYEEEKIWHKHIEEITKNKCDYHCSPFDERNIGNSCHTCLPQHFKRWKCTHYEPVPECPLDVKVKIRWNSGFPGEWCGDAIKKRRVRKILSKKD